MKIALIGPGIMPIPPSGWGAVEILIWDYYKELTELGHEVDIINPIRNDGSDQSNPTTNYCQELISKVNQVEYDFVHLHYDCLHHILPFLTCKKKAITSHYPYIDQMDKHGGDGYSYIFKSICNNVNHIIFALSKKDYNVFCQYTVNKSNIFLCLNGANEKEIIPIDNGTFIDKSIYIGKIEERKQQHKYCSIPNIDFYGKCDDNGFKNLSFYKGEPSRNDLVNALVNYGNLVLLSIGENGTPLVIKEGLMAGLPIVTNKYNIDDIDVNLPFIDIIPDDKLEDLVYISRVIAENRKKRSFQTEIREYAVTHFSWKKLVKDYIENI
jgi:glycosyltransferase involved in cell wall biosynthesis